MDKNQRSTEELLRELDFAYEFHIFQMRRIERLVGALRNKFGDGVIDIIGELNVNYKELVKWYLQHTSELIEAVKKKYGDEVLEVITKEEMKQSLEIGALEAKRVGGSSIVDIEKIWGYNDFVEREPHSVLIRRKNGCPVGRIAREMGLTDLMYRLECSNDACMVEGFNENFKCELRKSYILGDDYCEWYIYEK